MDAFSRIKLALEQSDIANLVAVNELATGDVYLQWGDSDCMAQGSHDQILEAVQTATDQASLRAACEKVGILIHVDDRPE